jgi:hypothetical protein
MKLDFKGRTCRFGAFIAMTAGTLSAQTPTTPAEAAPTIAFHSPDDSLFVIREMTMTPSLPSRLPVFRAMIDNRSGVDWVDVGLTLAADISCPNLETKRLEFSVLFSHLVAGDTGVSDVIIAARGALDNGCVVFRFIRADFVKGSTLEERERIELKEQRAGIAREIAEMRAANEASAAKAHEKAATCHALFRVTSDKKVSDLTVRESKLVEACSALGEYHDP